MNTVGFAKEAVTMLESQHRDNYSLIKHDVVDMFGVTNNQELYKHFFKFQAATHRDSNCFLHQVSVLCE